MEFKLDGPGSKNILGKIHYGKFNVYDATPTKCNHSKRRYLYEQDKLDGARKLGYTSIIECIVKEYRKGYSPNAIGEVLGMTGQGVRARLRSFGEPLRSVGSKAKKYSEKRVKCK